MSNETHWKTYRNPRCQHHTSTQFNPKKEIPHKTNYIHDKHHQ